LKYLIVNADDFGAGSGINRAIVELHELGVVTSTSLMTTMPAAADAMRFARETPRLSVGLHATLTDEACNELVDFDAPDRCTQAIEAQIDHFCACVGRLPTHLDSHQNVHRDARLAPIFAAFASRYELPLREHPPVRYFSSFYGQWDGEPHPEQIGIENLIRMLDAELGDGILELSCHPGYTGAGFTSPYDGEREIELRTLSDPRLREFLRDRSVQLIGFRDVHVVAHAS